MLDAFNQPEEVRHDLVRRIVKNEYDLLMKRLEELKAHKADAARRLASVTKSIESRCFEVEKLADWLRNNP